MSLLASQSLSTAAQLRNTKFFHAMANGRHRANHIEVVEDEGIILVREKDKCDYFFHKFKDRFALDNLSTPSLGD